MSGGGEICQSPSCKAAVAWSQKHNKFTKLCEDHLNLHRQRCHLSNLRKQQAEKENKFKIQNYSILHAKYLNLEKEYKKLLKQQSQTAAV